MNKLDRLIEPFKEIERHISQERGDFSLFALFQQEHMLPMWDVLVSAPWIDKDSDEALRYIAGVVQSAFSKEDIINVSRIVIISTDSPGLDEIVPLVHVKHGERVFENREFLGQQIRKAVFITANIPAKRRQQVPAA